MDDTMTIQVGPVPTNETGLNLIPFDSRHELERTRHLAESDREALRAVADWVEAFVVRPHPDLGRAGPVCPFTPQAIDHGTLWLAAERSAGLGTPGLVQLVSGYQRALLANPPVEGDAAVNKSIVIVFTDLPATQASDFFAGALEQIAVPSYVEQGLVMGPFFEGNEGTAIYNPGFRPFQSPVPLLLIRRAVVSDWKFFLNNESWFNLWSRRFGEAGIKALADELRLLPWNARRA